MGTEADTLVHEYERDDQTTHDDSISIELSPMLDQFSSGTVKVQVQAFGDGSLSILVTDETWVIIGE